MAWTKIVEVRDGHSYWADEHDRIAITDQSIRNPRDPATTDDGLVLVDFEREALLEGHRLWIPTKLLGDDRKYSTTENVFDGVGALRLLAGAGLKVRIPPNWIGVTQALHEIIHRQ